MATLTRPRTAPTTATTSTIAAGVPAPFPTELFEGLRTSEVEPRVERDGETTTMVCVERGEETATMTDIMPSIATLEKSCILTLNTLLSGSPHWKSIVPERRHSMPGTSEPASISALGTLVSNLRIQQQTDDEEMIQFLAPSSDVDLAFELRERVLKLSPTLPPHDAALANSLATILTYFNRLDKLQAPETTRSPAPVAAEDDRDVAPPPIDMYEALTRQLNHLQFERLISPPISNSSSTTSNGSVTSELSILWTQIDRELENVANMCKGRALPSVFYQDAHLPPQYEYDSYDDECPPEYDGTGRPSMDKDYKMASPRLSSDEKMRLDLEGIAMAIDRLYQVAPQLHNQRVELKSSKLRELERARKEGGSVSSRKGKEREKRELDGIIERLAKASERSLRDQAVVLEDGVMESRLERAKMKDMAKREAFVEGLILHSAAGRLHGQDATLTPRRIKDPQAKLTLPEFMRENIPLDSDLLQDPEVMLSLPEFVAQHLASEPESREASEGEQLNQKGSVKSKRKSGSGTSSRSRSLSAPPLAWLRSKSSSSQTSGAASPKLKQQHDTAFDIVYVAENHENLHHVLVFFTTTPSSTTPGEELTAEILPPFPEHISTGGDHFIIRSGAHTSLPLVLPARTTPGRKEIRMQRGHCEIKLGTVSPPGGATDEGADINSPLMDAQKLMSVNPSAFICASCSLPLVQIPTTSSSPSSPAPGTSSPFSPSSPSAAGRATPSRSSSFTYRDLPSEHWEELVEAWMCHADQKLHEQVVKHGKAGFWPARGEAFVGGSYVLFEEGVVVKQNLVGGGSGGDEDKNNEDWKVRRCLCGSIIGRSTTRPDPLDATTTTTCFRVLKYAIRPVTANPSDSLKIPLSAFIVEDMMEYVHAHASYRFVVRDEEDEQPRILIWLFKPKMKLSYTTPRSRAIPKSGSITAAKVLYKLLGPSEAKVDLKTLLNKYPGFPQAEYLSYPMSICRRVAALLKESNTAYPEGLRTMTGLEVGWLHRR